MEYKSYNIPILILGWRRPNHLKLLIEVLRSVKPDQIYLVIDGPREGIEFEEERKLIEETKKIASNEVNWNCKLKTLFRDKNLGCAIGVSNGIDWFFDYVDYGIILEDDVIPTIEFFEFMRKQLLKHLSSSNIFMINSTTDDELLSKLKYNIIYKSKFSKVWGWATYKDKWEKYKLYWSNIEYLNFLIERELICKKDIEMWKEIAKWVVYDFDSLNTWDYQWQFTIWQNNGLCISPNKWLIKNIGFGPEGLGVHTTGNEPNKIIRLLQNSDLSKRTKEVKWVFFPLYSKLFILIYCNFYNRLLKWFC